MRRFVTDKRAEHFFVCVSHKLLFLRKVQVCQVDYFEDHSRSREEQKKTVNIAHRTRHTHKHKKKLKIIINNGILFRYYSDNNKCKL